MAKYLTAINAAQKAECVKHLKSKKPCRRKLRHLLKLTKYITRAIYGN